MHFEVWEKDPNPDQDDKVRWRVDGHTRAARPLIERTEGVWIGT